MKFILSSEDLKAILEAAIRDKFTPVLPEGYKMVIDINSYQTDVRFVPDVPETFAARTEAILEGE